MTLRILADRTAAPGQIATANYISDYPLVYANSPDEMLFYIKQLGKLGFAEVSGQFATITTAGYQRLQELQTASIFSNTAFVAMSFANELKPVYEEAIEPAVKKAGYRPLIMWRYEHVNRIDDEIIAQIRRAKFMVADFTQQNPGAYFEAGFMQGLGRPVFWMCNESEKSKLHFDTRQYNHILYNNLEDARKRLYNRIMAIVGQGRGADVA